MRSHPKNPFRWLQRTIIPLSKAISVCCIASTSIAFAAPADQAKRIHDRIAGVPPTADVLNEMSTLIQQNNPLAAAELAMENPAFYNVSLKELVTPWTNEAQSVHAPLNDYTATVIGIVRDDRPFTEVLTEDIVYIGATGVVQPDYSQTDNEHYVALENNRIDLSNPQNLVATTQSSLPNSPLPADATAGVITLRASAEAFFKAGTNRAALRYTAMNYLCQDLEELKDITRVPDRIRQDVSRSPGGDSSIFLNKCIGCHAGMDPLAGAFAYYDFDEEQGQLTYTPGQVTEKHLINAGVFPNGYVTTNDSWKNYWRSGPNEALGWGNTAGEGNGAKSFGAEIAGSRAFSECQVEKVFERVCLRSPSNIDDRMEIQRISTNFENSNYSLKSVFAETAVYCMGD